MPACTFRLGGEPNADDAVRAENMDLKKQVGELQKSLELRSGELAAMRQAQDHGPMPMPGADTPTLAKVEFGRYSGAIDTDNDGKDDAVRVYIQTLDQRGRFLPVAGRGVLQMVLIVPDAEPRILAQVTYDPPQWDGAYRAGITGTHYTVQMPLPDDAPAQVIEATMKFTFTQADTGAVFSTQSAARIDR